ncbi:hypothetical protein LY76DRAFT_465820, partial [Colletotrichum caudatum]
VGTLGPIYLEEGKLKEAEKLLARAVDISKKANGEDALETLSATSHLASTFGCQGRWKKAEDIHRRVMEACEKKVGAEDPDHPLTLTSMSNLATALLQQDLWEKAERLVWRVVEARERTIGFDHPDTLGSIMNLAEIATWRKRFFYQEKWGEAEVCAAQATGEGKKKNGHVHLETLVNMHLLASTQMHQGRCEDAAELMRDCMRRTESVFG